MFGPLPHRVARSFDGPPSLRRERATRASLPAASEVLPQASAPPVSRVEAPAKLALALGALGVVYGDIGTNPLFALEEAFGGTEALERTPANVLGVLSLVFWSLIVVVSIKYLAFVMRASNEGEGGILALLALVPKQGAERPRWLVLAVLFGAALLYGDGVITPAISVLSAVEGLKPTAPFIAPAVVPITVVILIALFLAQKHGTARIGTLFGPVMVLWFVAIGVLGARQILGDLSVLRALDPRHALSFLAHGHGHVTHVLGAVVLTIAGGEALYADMGHFGRRPIQVAWYAIVLPSLVLNYFGQGSRLLAGHLPAETTPFFALVPSALVVPMVILATLATVIASQALISGAFSLTQQAIELGYFPRLRVLHTSADQIGQIYVPTINGFLMIACIALVVGFGASERLAAAYGLAVSGTMAITTVAYFIVLRERYRRSLALAASLAIVFGIVDFGFLGANLTKFVAGGWVPVGIGLVVYSLMTTWTTGRRLLAENLSSRFLPLATFIDDVKTSGVTRVKGTGVFMTASTGSTPLSLLHHFKHNQVLHETLVILSVKSASIPFVPANERIEVEKHGAGVYAVVITSGFLERPNVPELLAECAAYGLDVDCDRTTYYLGRETLVPTKRNGMLPFRKEVFAFIARNAQSAPRYFGLPPNRVVELGMQVEI